MAGDPKRYASCHIVLYGGAPSAGDISPIAINLTRAVDTISITILQASHQRFGRYSTRLSRLFGKIGPVRIVPEKTRIAFQVRMSFAQVTPKLKLLDGHVVLARRSYFAR